MASRTSSLLREPDIVPAFERRSLRPLHDIARSLGERAIDQKRLIRDLDPDDLVDILIAPAIYQPISREASTQFQFAERIFVVVMDGVERE